jgi:S1-C subfamily serine protease
MPPTKPVRRDTTPKPKPGTEKPGKAAGPKPPAALPLPTPLPPPPAITPSRGAGARPLLGSVVKVLTVADAPDYEQPWQTHGAQASTGSGAVIATERGLRVLTNAHVVMNQVFVEVRRSGSAAKFTARVEAVVHECDLALLAVKDERFFEGAEPVQLGELPHLGDRVTVCGYPIGGDRLSLTEGVVSRIEVGAYAHSQRPLLAVQIDAAVNAGNSGGPVFAGDRLIGVAFQSLDDAQNVAYAIAPPIVRHFLRDIATAGPPRGFPSLGVGWQRLESTSHRKALGLSPTDGGIMVTKVAYDATSWGVLQAGDVILAVDDIPVHSDGTAVLRPSELVDHAHFVSLRLVGETMPVLVQRAGQRAVVHVELKTPRLLVPDDRYDVRPTYFIFGGLLFAPLTRDYLKSWGHEWWKQAPSELMSLYHTGFCTPERQDVVVLQKVLADGVNQGYHEIENAVVVQVDGVPVRNMRHLVDLVETGLADPARGPWLKVRLAGGENVVLDRKKSVARLPAILDLYGVREDRSKDMQSKKRR